MHIWAKQYIFLIWGAMAQAMLIAPLVVWYIAKQGCDLCFTAATVACRRKLMKKHSVMLNQANIEAPGGWQGFSLQNVKKCYIALACH